MQIRNSHIVPIWPHAFPLEVMTKMSLASEMKLFI